MVLEERIGWPDGSELFAFRSCGDRYCHDKDTPIIW